MTTFNCFVKDSFALAPTSHGPLDGTTFAVKDCMAIAGHVSSFGHPAWRATHSASTTTAPVVTKLLTAGARMEGLTKLDQLTYSLTGNVGEDEAPINPLYPDRFTGGSSSGSASAVAGGIVDFAIGTDTAGSIRVPASSCGVFGIRPTHGRIDTSGVISLAPSFDTVGLMARDAELLRKVFAIIDELTGNPKKPKRPGMPLRRLLLAVDCLKLVDLEVAETVQDTATQLARANKLKLEEVTLGEFIDPKVSDLFTRLQSREIWAQHGAWTTKHMSELAPNIQDRLQNLCKKYAASSESEKQADIAAWQAYRRQLETFVQPGTVIIMPITSALPPERTTQKNESVFRQHAFRLTAPAGLAGMPEVVVPASSQSGLTFGVGLLGARGEDITLLDMAASLKGGERF